MKEYRRTGGYRSSMLRHRRERRGCHVKFYGSNSYWRKSIIMRQIFLILSLTCGVVSQSISQEQDLQFLKYNNPGLIVDLGVGLWAWPLPVDYDNDGDMDLVVSSQGRPFNGLYLFENISGDEKPVFAKPKWLNKSVKDIQISYHEGKPIFSGPGVIYTDFLNTYTKKKDRKSTRLNSSHVKISYAVFCLK